MAEKGGKIKLPNWAVAEKKVFVEHIAAQYKVMMGGYEVASWNQADRRTAWDEAV